MYDSPAKTIAEIEYALALGVRLNADNLDEVARITAVRARMSSSSVLGLRVNPRVGTGTVAATSVAGRTSKFGVPIERADAILATFAACPWLTALHVHVGSQGCPLDMLILGAARMARLRTEIHRHLGHAQISTVDLGGGLPVAYRAGDTPPSLEDYAAALRREAPALFEDDVVLVTEFGRSVHATAGWAVSRVEYVKEVGGERLAVIHLGADFLLRKAYAPADWHHDVAVFDPTGHSKSGPLEPVTVVGPLCFAGDVIARGPLLPRIEPGDLLVIRDTGAYTLSLWSRHCSRGLPLVLGHDAGGLQVLKARETPAGVVAFWSRGG